MKPLSMILSLVLIGLFCGQPAVAQSFEALSPDEQRAMADTFQYALENNKTNEQSEWVNPDAVRSGGVVPIKTFYNDQGLPCREFTQTIIIADKEEQGYGTACRQPDGSWQIVSDQKPSPAVTQVKPAENRTIVYINETPWPGYYGYWYASPYRYWYPYYYPSYFNFSFNYVYHSGKYYQRPRVKPRYYYIDDSPRVIYKRYDKPRRVRVDTPVYERERPAKRKVLKQKTIIREQQRRWEDTPPGREYRDGRRKRDRR